MLLMGGSYTDYTKDANCQGAWRFDPVEGKLLDISGDDAYLTLGDTPTYTTDGSCVESNCYDYDGDNDYLTAGVIDMAGWDGLSVSVWVNYDSSGSDEHLAVSNWDGGEAKAGFMIRLEPTDDSVEGWVLQFNNSDIGGTFNDTTITANTWFHIVLTYDKSAVRCYVNGVVDTTTHAGSNALDDGSSEALDIGYNHAYGGDAGGDYFDGLIDEVAIWDRALTAAEVKDIYLHGLR